MTKRLNERGAILRGIRRFFEARGFLEVETPILVPSPGLDVHLDAFELETTVGASPARYLITSPEYQMKRLLADGYEKIFQVTKVFRRGERGARHNPEFTMLEWYRANASVLDVMRDTEELVAETTDGKIALGPRRVLTMPPFPRMTVCEAFESFARVTPDETLRLAAEEEDVFFRLLVERVEPKIELLDRPLFLTEYPATQASLARNKPDDPRVAERFELYVAGVELCNGFGELTDPTEQRARLERDRRERKIRGLPVYPLDERFLGALVRGIPESGGNALGVDRLVALACGTTNIGDVMAFTEDEL